MTKRFVVALVFVCGVLAPTGPGFAQGDPKTPPCSAPEHSQFDFWVGTWKVEDEGGNIQGTNRIEKILDGCALQEDWTGASGMHGHSYSIYAKRRGIWHQTWVDSNGLLLLLDGGFEKGRMVLRGRTPARDAKGIVEHEISWESLSDGRVLQRWRTSKDGGSTWNDLFVGLYTRQTD